MGVLFLAHSSGNRGVLRLGRFGAKLRRQPFQLLFQTQPYSGECGWIQTEVFAFLSNLPWPLVLITSVASQSIHIGEEAQPGATGEMSQGQTVSMAQNFFHMGTQQTWNRLLLVQSGDCSVMESYQVLRL